MRKYHNQTYLLISIAMALNVVAMMLVVLSMILKAGGNG